jgi:hypothetical protein
LIILLPDMTAAIVAAFAKVANESAAATLKKKKTKKVQGTV